MSKELVSAVVPCRNEAENIFPMYHALKDAFAEARVDYEIIFVDNASTDHSEKVFRKLARRAKRVRVILMSRNFGSPQPSYLAGLKHARGDAAVLVAGDMEDPPDLIPQFIAKWRAGFDVVYGIRHSVRAAPMRSLMYKIFYWLFKKMAYIDIPFNAGDFSLMSRRVINEVIKFDERDFYLRGVRAYVGFKQTGVEFVREMRLAGRTSTNFFQNLWWAKTIIINFSFKPLEWISKLAFIVVALAFVLLAVNVVLYLAHPQSPPGVPTLVLSVLFLGGIQLLAIAVIGEYLARMFVEIKNRPRYIIKEIINGR